MEKVRRQNVFSLSSPEKRVVLTRCRAPNIDDDDKCVLEEEWKSPTLFFSLYYPMKRGNLQKGFKVYKIPQSSTKYKWWWSFFFALADSEEEEEEANAHIIHGMHV